ncbi:hypothetical protein [Streptomyces sp. NEAU-S7GS2]|nr:hypothetical protein [Streptomyces sp. NEAU-S7GS2]
MGLCRLRIRRRIHAHGIDPAEAAEAAEAAETSETSEWTDLSG